LAWTDARLACIHCSIFKVLGRAGSQASIVIIIVTNKARQTKGRISAILARGGARYTILKRI
jgi:hypothetical protein